MFPPFVKSRFALTAALAILPLTTAPAFCDSYQVTVLSNTQHEAFYGIDNAGDFVVNLGGDIGVGEITPCGSNATTCFATHYTGQSNPVYTTTAPALSYDNGTPCSPALFAGFTPLQGACNNGHSIVGGTDAQGDPGVWDGPDPVTDLLLAGASFDGGFVNANGDAVFMDGNNNELISAVDLSTSRATSPVPEPNSFLLLGTGCLSLFGAVRRLIRS